MRKTILAGILVLALGPITAQASMIELRAQLDGASQVTVPLDSSMPECGNVNIWRSPRCRASQPENFWPSLAISAAYSLGVR